jgi:FtsP/CotA-like multicopper oxidase with cupredoxin domain
VSGSHARHRGPLFGPFDRRRFLKLAGGGIVLGAAGAVGGAELLTPSHRRPPLTLASAVTGRERDWHLVATDGYVAMPDPKIVRHLGVFYPDVYGPVDDNGDGQNTYVFGFVDVDKIDQFGAANLVAPWDPGQLKAPIDFKGLAGISAPLLYCDDGDDVRIQLENLGFAVRPDLFDAHTIHWHGFANQIPYFDGVPDASLSVPSGSSLTYRYLPIDVGTYMYHCHVEDVEHVHMGLTGMVFVRTSKNSPRWAAYNAAHPGTPLDPSKKYAYYDPSTRYDREFALLVTELDVEPHWNDGHIQATDWSEYRSTFGLFNGRSWPDTIEPNGPFYDRDTDTWQDSQLSGLAATRLAYQHNSSLIQAESGEKVLVRISNLGFDEHSLVLPNLPMTVVGRDAKFLGQGRPDYYFGSTATRDGITTVTNRIDIGPGESRDVIFTAPSVPSKTVFPFYDRASLFLEKASGPGGAVDGFGSMRTEVHVYPAGSLGAQHHPNWVKP